MVASASSQMMVEVTVLGVGEMLDPPGKPCTLYINPRNIIYVSPAVDDGANFNCIIKLLDVQPLLFIKDGVATVLSQIDRAVRFMNMLPVGHTT